MSTSNILKKVTHDRNFTIIDNKLLQNPNLSAKAKGIACYLLSLPDDWIIHQEELTKHFTDGLSAIKSGVKELKEHGYISIVSIKNELGRITEWHTYIREDLNLPFPNKDAGFIQKSIFHNVDSPQVENHQLLSTNNKTNNEFKKELSDLNFSNNEICQTYNHPSSKIRIQEIFERLWEYYPVKKGKQVAYEAFLKLIADKTLEEIEKLAKDIWRGLVGMLQEDRWLREFKEHECPKLFIPHLPHGSTFFNQKRWLDNYEIDGDIFIQALRVKNLSRKSI